VTCTCYISPAGPVACDYCLDEAYDVEDAITFVRHPASTLPVTFTPHAPRPSRLARFLCRLGCHPPYRRWEALMPSRTGRDAFYIRCPRLSQGGGTDPPRTANVRRADPLTVRELCAALTDLPADAEVVISDDVGGPAILILTEDLTVIETRPH